MDIHSPIVIIAVRIVSFPFILLFICVDKIIKLFKAPKKPKQIQQWSIQSMQNRLQERKSQMSKVIPLLEDDQNYQSAMLQIKEARREVYQLEKRIRQLKRTVKGLSASKSERKRRLSVNKLKIRTEQILRTVPTPKTTPTPTFEGQTEYETLNNQVV
ncbi:hypothetical protein AKO1_014857 [Acrasis kona]|uniref:Uncharacterized protein n=1 Tax=Acrasis kona TaxID=1008807 RepID=A0AAW2Z179_9EUKA